MSGCSQTSGITSFAMFIITPIRLFVVFWMISAENETQIRCVPGGTSRVPIIAVSPLVSELSSLGVSSSSLPERAEELTNLHYP